MPDRRVEEFWTPVPFSLRGAYVLVAASPGRSRKRLIGLCALLAGVVFAATQACGDEPGIAAGPLRFRRWRVESGLPLTRIPIFAQTSDGYLWLGAAGEGLFRFDGTRFSAPDDGLWPRWSFPGGNDVTTLFACRDGRLCVGTQDGLWTLKVGQWNRITTQDGLSNNISPRSTKGPTVTCGWGPPWG